jgi:hypothetical protein
MWAPPLTCEPEANEACNAQKYNLGTEGGTTTSSTAEQAISGRPGRFQ